MDEGGIGRGSVSLYGKGVFRCKGQYPGAIHQWYPPIAVLPHTPSSPALLLVSCAWSLILDSPKSATLTSKRALTKRLAGFKSLGWQSGRGVIGCDRGDASQDARADGWGRHECRGGSAQGWVSARRPPGRSAPGARLVGKSALQRSTLPHPPRIDLWMTGGCCACRQDMPRAMSRANSTFLTRSRCRPAGGGGGRGETPGALQRGEERLAATSPCMVCPPPHTQTQQPHPPLYPFACLTQTIFPASPHPSPCPLPLPAPPQSPGSSTHPTCAASGPGSPSHSTQ